MKFSPVFTALVAVLAFPLSARAEVIARDVDCQYRQQTVRVVTPDGNSNGTIKIKVLRCESPKGVVTIISPRSEETLTCGRNAANSAQEVCADVQRRVIHSN